MKLAQAANIYLDRKEPWKTIKTNREATATTVYVTLRVIDSLKTIFAPFLPFSAQKVHEFLGYKGQLFGQSYTETFTETTRQHTGLCYNAKDVVGRWEPSRLLAGQALQQPAPLFKKLDPEATVQELARMLEGTAVAESD